MGFFSDFKEQLATGGNIVTKTVEGTVANVGRLKIQMIDEMAAQGYNLVNEVSESIYYKRMFGETASGVRYTLTFKIDPIAVQRIEEQKKREELLIKQEEDKKRREIEQEYKIIQEKKVFEDEVDDYAENLLNALDNGYCVIIEGPSNSAIKAINECLKKYDLDTMYEYSTKCINKTLKKTGRYCALADFGENACINLCNVLSAYEATVRVAKYNDNDYIEQVKIHRHSTLEANGVFTLEARRSARDIAKTRLGHRLTNGKNYTNKFYSMLAGE